MNLPWKVGKVTLKTLIWIEKKQESDRLNLLTVRKESLIQEILPIQELPSVETLFWHDFRKLTL